MRSILLAVLSLVGLAMATAPNNKPDAAAVRLIPPGLHITLSLITHGV